jgi:hypothetical protein
VVQKLTQKGQWRVRVTYDGSKPLQETALAYWTIRV